MMLDVDKDLAPKRPQGSSKGIRCESRKWPLSSQGEFHAGAFLCGSKGQLNWSWPVI